jgi:hypothetical protein
MEDVAGRSSNVCCLAKLQHHSHGASAGRQREIEVFVALPDPLSSVADLLAYVSGRRRVILRHQCFVHSMEAACDVSVLVESRKRCPDTPS